MVEVARITHAMKNPRFVHRVLTERERVYCRTPESVAGRWAAKEAIAKAVCHDLTWQQVEITNAPGGAPEAQILVSGFATSGKKLHLSISHERGHAVAVAILEKA